METERFKVYSSYRLGRYHMFRTERCWFQQITPVIGADQCVYGCKDVSYTANGLIGSIADRTFADLWYSEETAAWFKAFNPQKRCAAIQCAAFMKNKIYDELVGVHGDAFV